VTALSTPPSTTSAGRHAVRELFGEILHPDVLTDLRRLGQRAPGPVDIPVDEGEAELRASIWRGLVDLGALDLDLTGQTALAELLGEAAVPLPMTDTMAANDFLLAAGHSPAMRVPVAIAAMDRPHGTLGTPGTIEPVPGGYQAQRTFVSFADSVHTILLAGTGDHGDVRYVLAAPIDPGVSAQRQDDIGRGELYQVTFEVDHLDGTLPRSQWRDVVTAAQIRQAAVLTGLAAASLRLAVGYARQRRQFDVPIARHQSVAFRLSAHHVEIEAARELTFLAARESLSGAEFADVTSAQALALAGETALTTTTDCLHIQGAHGLTTECDAQLLYRKAAVESVRLGHPSRIRNAIIGRFRQRCDAELNGSGPGA
jgi:butyryl-CoA dehydrogenase